MSRDEDLNLPPEPGTIPDLDHGIDGPPEAMPETVHPAELAQDDDHEQYNDSDIEGP